MNFKEYRGLGRTLDSQEVLLLFKQVLLCCWCTDKNYLAERSIVLHIDYALLVREIYHLASTHNFLLLSTSEKFWFKFSWRWDYRSSSTIHCQVIPFCNFCFLCQYFWKPSGKSELDLFSSEKTTYRHSLSLMVWYWRAYSSRFSLCFLVHLGW